jgi:glycine/serine hydroxymethyltransferase
MREGEMDQIAALIGRVLGSPDDDRVAGAVKDEVERLCRKFPLYPDPLA